MVQATRLLSLAVLLLTVSVSEARDDARVLELASEDISNSCIEDQVIWLKLSESATNELSSRTSSDIGKSPITVRYQSETILRLTPHASITSGVIMISEPSEKIKDLFTLKACSAE